MNCKQKRNILAASMLVLGLAASVVNTPVIADAAEETNFSLAPEFEEIVIVDDENCCFKITGVEEDAVWGYTWKVYAENKTDKTLMFSFDDVAVNGYMCDPFWATEVTAGMKSNSEVSWFTNEFEENGITEVENVVFTLRVSDSDDWMADPYLESVYTVAASDNSESSENSGEKEGTVALDAEANVIVDNEHCFFSITNMKEDDIWGYTWDVYLENRMDKTMMFSLNDVSVNGFVCDPFWGTEITAGMKSNESISWIGDDFTENGIAEVQEVEFVLRVSDSEDWMADPVLEEMFVIYPLGEDAVEKYERTPVDGEQVILDNEYCSMIVTGFAEDDIWGYGMKIYLENKTEEKVMFSLNDVTVNGFMCDPFWAASVPAEKRSNTAVTWFSDTFEENGITQVEKIQGSISVRNDETYDEYVNESFEIVPWD